MKPARLTPVAPAAEPTRDPRLPPAGAFPAFAVVHIVNALQLAEGRVRAERATASAKERDAKDRERALRFIRTTERRDA